MPNIIESMRARQIHRAGSAIYGVEHVTLKEHDFVVHLKAYYAIFEAQLDGDGNPVIRLVTEPLSADKMLAHELITKAQYEEFVAECAREDHEKLEQIEFREYLRLSKKFGEVNLDEAIKACELIHDSLHSLRTGTPKSSSL